LINDRRKNSMPAHLRKSSDDQHGGQKARLQEHALDVQVDRTRTPGRSEPSAIGISKMGGTLGITAHSTALNRVAASQPGRSGPSLLQLQQQYGNRYVQRMMSLFREGESDGQASVGVDQAIQRARGSRQSLDNGVRAQMQCQLIEEDDEEKPFQTRARALEVQQQAEEKGSFSILEQQRTLQGSPQLIQIQRDRTRSRTRTITFEEAEPVVGHVTPLGQDISGVDVARFIDHEIVQELERGWDALVLNYLGGIQNFETYMQFPSEHEARADYLKAALKFAGEQLLSAAVNQVKRRIPGFDIAVGFVRAMMAEHDRAAQAARRVRVRNYIADYRTTILEMNTGFKRTIGELDEEIQVEFQRRASTAPAELAEPTRTAEAQPRRTVAGPGAEYLNSLLNVVTEWRDNVPSPEAFLQRILERWVGTRERAVESEGGGAVYMGGRIYLKVKLYKDGDNWRITETPSKGRLAAPEANKTVDALKRVMREQSIYINDLDILKALTIEVEDEVSWFNDDYRVHLHYRRPDTVIYNSGGIPSPVNRETVRKADAIAAEAVRRVDRNAIGRIRDLEAY
jgi:hypothetical protein